MNSRYAHARQIKRAKYEQKKLKNYLGQVGRNILRNCPQPDEQLAELLANARRLLLQKHRDKNKLYSLHAPEAECIGKFKAHKKYEFGCKVSVVTTSKDIGLVGVEALHINRYQGNPKQLAQTNIHLANRRKKSMKPSEWRWFSRRRAIEPVSGHHMKNDNQIVRNYLKSTDGARMNAILAACGFNLKKLLRVFIWLIFKELERLKMWLQPLKIFVGQSAAMV